MNTIQALQSRKSVRSYLEKTVEADKLDRIIEAGKHAPNAGAFQITVIKNARMLQEINDRTLEAMKNSGNDFLMQRAAIPGYNPLYGAPVLLLLSVPAGPYAQANAACAATCMTLAATALGLGSCYVVSPTLALDGKNDLSVNAGIGGGYAPSCGVLVGYEKTGSIPPARKADVSVNFVE